MAHASDAAPRGTFVSRPTVIGTVTLLLLLMATVLVLAREVRRLMPLAAELQQRKVLPYVGQLVPIAWGVTPAGDSIELGNPAPGTSQVLVFFETSCGYCAETLPRWKELARTLASDSVGRLSMIGISLSPADSTRDYVAAHNLPVVRIADVRLRQLFRVKGVPMTLVIDPRGLVAHVRASVIRSQVQLDSIVNMARTVASVSAPVVGER